MSQVDTTCYMIPNNRLWLLMSRRLSGEASPSERQELQDLLEQSPDKLQLLDILHAYFTVPLAEAVADMDDLELEERFRRMLEQAPQKDFAVMAGEQLAALPAEPMPLFQPVSGPSSSQKNGRVIALSGRKMIYYAAALGGLLVLAWAISPDRRPAAIPAAVRPASGGEVLAKAGARTKLLLPDGTQVWLNSNSKLKYAADFNIHSREVELEAYFDVVRDMQRPFIVHASSIDVRVLGTAFTVKSYPQDETVEATLLRGAIEVSGRDNPNAPRVILKPDEKLVLDKHLLSAVPVAAGSVNPVNALPVRPDISVNTIRTNIPDSDKVETAWLYNRLVFTGDTFQELAKKMERWYNVRIVFRDESLYKYRFAGAFANETVQDALNALQLTAPFTYKINGDDIELYEK